MKRIMLPVLILAVGIGGFVYLKRTQPASEPIQTSERAWVVQVSSVQPTTLSPSLTLYGQVETPRHTTLRAPNSVSSPTTEVIEVRVLEGQRVPQGELLARLNDRDIQLTVQQRQADIEDIEAQINIEKQTHEDNITAIAHEEMLLKLAEKTFQRLQRLEQQQLTSSAALEEAQ
ncbi:MAG: biotin/lipoyl-binding protein, partial [Pseudomonadota bacterium]|nr:biotin/lipoyl-binding protein [Pseudomonadota bacterium]